MQSSILQRTAFASAALFFFLPLATHTAAQNCDLTPGACRTERLSYGHDGTPPDAGAWWPDISADGRFVSFGSHATNLVPGDTNAKADIFVIDRQTGVTTRVSVSSTNVEGNDDSLISSISSDGRYIAFGSDATNLVSGDTNAREDVFVHDGATGITVRASISSTGTQGTWDSYDANISADGCYVTFWSSSPQLVPGDTNGWSDIFVHDLVLGTTERASVDSFGGQADAWCEAPELSADGRYVAFYTYARLVPDDFNGKGDIYVRDRWLGQTSRCSLTHTGQEANGTSSHPSISADGRLVAFYSGASDLVPGDTNLRSDIFVRDLVAGTTRRVSVSSLGAEADEGAETYLSLSGDGRFVAFESEATNLVPRETHYSEDIFVHELATGRTWLLVIGLGGAAPSSSTERPQMCHCGRSVAFQSYADNLVEGDTFGTRDVFVRSCPPHRRLLPPKRAKPRSAR